MSAKKTTPKKQAKPPKKRATPPKKAPPAAPAPPLDARARAALRKLQKQQDAERKTHERLTLKNNRAQRLAEYTAEEQRLAELLKQLRSWRRKCSAARTLEQFKALPSISAAAKHHAGAIFSFKG